MIRREDLRLYVVTDPVLVGDRDLVDVCDQVYQSGVRVIQLRDKHASTQDLIDQARVLCALAKKYDSYLLVNDRVDVALAADAHGVHLGQDDMELTEARSILGEQAIIGVSVRTPQEANQAEVDGADYIAANLVFPTATKTDIEQPLGLEGVRSLRKASTLPLVAIGGIDATNAGEVIKAGADGIAVVSAVIAAADVPGACRSLLTTISI